MGDDDEPADVDVSIDEQRMFLAPAAAFCRHKLGLDEPSNVVAIQRGRDAGLRLHRFKRATPLPRVQRVVGALKSLAPRTLLDIGTGRGVALWPLLEALPGVAVTCVEMRADRVDDLRALPGLPVQAMRADATALPFAADAFDVVTALEVLEHIGDARRAAREIVRVARGFVVVSVPSRPDDNPEHVHLFTRASLDALLRDAGAARVSIDAVLNHFVAVARVSP